MKKTSEQPLTKLADAAFEQAAQKVIERAEESGTPLVVWEDESVKEVEPRKVPKRPKTKAVVLVMAALVAQVAAAGTVTVWPAPEGEELSQDFSVAVDGETAPVYVARVAPEKPELRWKAMDDKANSADYHEEAAFTVFDMQGTVEVVVTCPAQVTSARILPSSLKIATRVEGHRVSITMSEPRALTLEVNGDWVHSLHILANPPEQDPPRKDDPDVIYFGPGIHEVTHMEVGSGKTLYVAGGAVVRGIIGPDEPFGISSYSGLKTYSPTFHLRGENITVRGRGIIDGSRCSTHARNLMLVQGSDIQLEGVVFRDSSTWNIPIRRCDRVTVRNVKILGYRANSDGIDICNSRDVTVEDCFIRTLDDLIVVKTDRDAGEARRIVARQCVLWNEVAHALSVGAELRENVDDQMGIRRPRLQSFVFHGPSDCENGCVDCGFSRTHPDRTRSDLESLAGASLAQGHYTGGTGQNHQWTHRSWCAVARRHSDG